MGMSRMPTTVFAIRLAREAAASIRAATRPRRVRLKSSAFDIQTETDRRVEAQLRRAIAKAYPGHTIVGEEETGFTDLDLDRPTWFLDPVDGTTNYYRGLPLVACNIAFWDGRRLASGVTADVARRRIFWAEAGGGAWQGRRRLHVSGTQTLTTAVVSTGFPPSRATDPDNNLAEFTEVVTQVRDVRRLGCAGLDTSWVASGFLDAYWEKGNGPWDWAVGALLVREAGGRATTYDGRDWVPGDLDFVASNGLIHQALLREMAAGRARA